MLLDLCRKLLDLRELDFQLADENLLVRFALDAQGTLALQLPSLRSLVDRGELAFAPDLLLISLSDGFSSRVHGFRRFIGVLKLWRFNRFGLTGFPLPQYLVLLLDFALELVVLPHLL